MILKQEQEFPHCIPWAAGRRRIGLRTGPLSNADKPGKKAVVYNQDKTPGHFQFLPGSEVIIHRLPDIENFDVAFVLDCSELERVGEGAQRIVKIKSMINIDHHVSNGGFCEVALIDPRASSTGELLFKIMVALDIALTQEMPPIFMPPFSQIRADFVTATHHGQFHRGRPAGRKGGQSTVDFWEYLWKQSPGKNRAPDQSPWNTDIWL